LDGPCGLAAPAGRVGVRAELGAGVSALANVGRYVRVPTLGERFGVTANVLGNEELLPETSVSSELGLGWAGALAPRLTLSSRVVGFARWVDALIVYRRASVGAARPFNVASARILGVEGSLGLNWRLPRDFVLRLEGAVLAMQPRDTTADRTTQSQLPFVAPLVGTSQLELVAPRWTALALERASLAVRLRGQDERLADPAGLIVLPSQVGLDVDVRAVFDPAFAFSVRLSNLLDRVLFDTIGYPLPGRAAYAQLEMTW
ncbi:MAG: TonB-dependent receptor, partial [Myxococcota bacterium]